MAKRSTSKPQHAKPPVTTQHDRRPTTKPRGAPLAVKGKPWTWTKLRGVTSTASWPEPFRRLAALRDLHYSIGDALFNPGYVRLGGAGPAVTSEALQAELDRRLARERRLKTPEALLDRWLHAPLDEIRRLALWRADRATDLEGKHRGGKRAGFVGWHAPVREIADANPTGTFQEIWHLIARKAAAGGSALVLTLSSNTSEACKQVRRPPLEDLEDGEMPPPVCVPGYHLHWRADDDDTIGSVPQSTVAAFVSRKSPRRRR